MDGGPLSSMKDAYNQVPLDAEIYWGVMEDVEHSRRGEALEYFCDYAPDVTAAAQRLKFTQLDNYPLAFRLSCAGTGVCVSPYST